MVACAAAKYAPSRDESTDEHFAQTYLVGASVEILLERPKLLAAVSTCFHLSFCAEGKCDFDRPSRFELSIRDVDGFNKTACESILWYYNSKGHCSKRFDWTNSRCIELESVIA